MQHTSIIKYGNDKASQSYTQTKLCETNKTHNHRVKSEQLQTNFSNEAISIIVHILTDPGLQCRQSSVSWLFSPGGTECARLRIHSLIM